MMPKFCTDCYHIGIGVHEEKCSWLGGLFLILFALFPLIVFRKSFILVLLIFTFISGFFLFYGIKFIIPCYRKEGNLCAKCKGTSLIPIDSERAQALIKEHNITIPEIKEEIISPKSRLPWQSS